MFSAPAVIRSSPTISGLSGAIGTSIAPLSPLNAVVGSAVLEGEAG